MREVERGFFAEAVREPDGAAAYDRGRGTWDDFVKKVRLGEDLNPQMQALDSTLDPEVQDHVARALSSLLQAAQVSDDERTFDGTADFTTPKALSMLADTALSEQMPPQSHLPRMDPAMSPASRHIPTSTVGPPQPPPNLGHSHGHGPTDPRSFILPRPTPTQQPRRLLPARGQLGLPDPFAMSGPPQLPPPPGSNFQRLPPLPNYFPPGGPAGAAPPAAPAAQAPGSAPGQMYFHSPHHSPHGGPPPPASRRY